MLDAPRADGGAAVGPAVLRLGRAWGVLILSYSSRLLSAARAEREEEVRGDRRAQRRVKSACVGRGEGGRGRATRASGRARPSER
jgi:hypothetical protein